MAIMSVFQPWHVCWWCCLISHRIIAHHHLCCHSGVHFAANGSTRLFFKSFVDADKTLSSLYLTPASHNQLHSLVYSTHISTLSIPTYLPTCCCLIVVLVRHFTAAQPLCRHHHFWIDSPSRKRSNSPVLLAHLMLSSGSLEHTGTDLPWIDHIFSPKETFRVSSFFFQQNIWYHPLFVV